MFLLSLLFPLINSLQNMYFYQGLGVKNFTFADSFLISSASTLANQLPIPGGILSRGFYFKKKFNLSYTKYTSSIFALFFFSVAVNGLAGLGVLTYWKLFTPIPVNTTLALAFFLMVASLLVFWIPMQKIRLPQKIQNLSNQAIEGWMTIRQSPGLIWKVILTQLAMIFFLSLRYWIAFRMVSQEVTFAQVLLFASASILTQLVTIAPGGLGVREAIVAGVATALGFDTSVSVVAVSLDRLVITIVIVLMGWVSTIILGRQISRAESANPVP